jgi:hypothetical protein
MTEAHTGIGFELSHPSVYERVAEISSRELDPNFQWRAIESIDQVKGIDPEDPGRLRRCEDDPGDIATALIDFALNDTSSSSTLVRAFALEKGVLGLRQAILADPYIRTRVRSDISFLYMELEEGFPELFDSHLRTELHGGHHPAIAPARREQIEAYRGAATALARMEGLGFTGTLRAYWDYSEFEGHSTDSYSGTPLLPFLAMEFFAGNDSVADRSHDPLLGFMTSRMIQESLGAILSFRREDTTEQKNAATEFSRLSRLARTGGVEHVDQLDSLYHLEPSARAEYVTALNRLYSQGEKLADLFPATDPRALSTGFRTVSANGLFAITHHIQNGETTDEELALLGGRVLPVGYVGNEPLDMIRETELIGKAREVMTHPDTEVVLAVDEANFVLYSFENAVLRDHPRVMKHIRPRGGHEVNYRYEYGGRHFGVQATSDTRIDPGQPIRPDRPYHKVSLSPQALSIRLDREGRAPGKAVALADQNPVSEQGTVSLDVGSLFSGGLGRFLAWGNVLRSQAIGQPQRLNHIEAFGTQLGTADGFAAMAMQEILFWEAKRAAREGDTYKPAALVAAGLALTAS